MDVFTVKFIRRDKKPNEEYFYHAWEDAEYHFSLFRNDDSNLYEEIVLVQASEEAETILDRIKFRTT